MRHGAQEYVVVETTLLENLRQCPRMTKAIHVEASTGNDAEFLFEVALCVQAMTDKGFTGRDVAIGFHPPATDDTPSPLAHALLDLGEHSCVRTLHPLIE